MSTFHGLPIHPLIVHAVVVLLPLAALAQWLVRRWWGGVLGHRWLAVLLAVVSVAVAVGVTVTVTRVGEAGARAVWSGVAQS